MEKVSLRLKKLKDDILNTMPELRVERSVIASRAYDKYNDENKILLRAKVLRDVLRELPINILEEELIVGLASDTLNVAQVFLPENGPAQLEAEIDGLDKRPQDKFYITEESKEQLRGLIDKWRGKTVSEKITSELKEEEKKLLDSGVFFIQKDVGYGHSLADYNMILNKGFMKIKEEAEEKLQKGEGTKENQVFWRGVAIVCEGAMDYALRYSALAKELAEKEINPRRKEELLNISRICAKVPAYPAEDFYEALQSLWLTHLIIQIESDGTGVSFGRFDQYMYPYYKKSLEKGKSREELQELLDCFWIKTNHLLKFRITAAAKLWSGYIMNQNITIGGQDKWGNDATNDLSYMCLEAQGKLGLKEPQFSLRVNKNTPDDLLEKAAEVLTTGGGKPQFVSDDTIITSLLSVGIPLKEARDYGIIGCVEPAVVGGWGRHKGGHLNLPKILELTLNNGIDPVKNVAVGKAVGPASSFKAFEDFWEAFKRELQYVMGTLVGIQRDVTHKALREEMPHIYLSTIYPDCIARGRDFSNGGTRYNWSSFTLTGMANLVDSIYTIKKLIFEEKSVTFEELMEALRTNYQENKQLLMKIRKLPKYGNDIEEVDKLANRIAELLYDTADEFRGDGDSKVTLGYVTVTKSVSYGGRTGPTPDGRLAFEAFADGVSPSHKYDCNGPTAVMNSVAHLDLVRAVEGAILNQKFVPDALNDQYKRKKFGDFVRAYMLDLSGLHIQFNVVSAETLRDAQAHPERYKNLLVRVSGFSAYFVELSREVQEDVIGRTEFQQI